MKLATIQLSRCLELVRNIICNHQLSLRLHAKGFLGSSLNRKALIASEIWIYFLKKPAIFFEEYQLKIGKLTPSVFEGANML